MYNPKEIEPEIFAFWDKNKIYEKAKSKNKGKKPFYYLDGPPYTSGRIHIGHAWGKALRDSIMRFLRMNGYDVFDRPGFDMHGMPTENKVAEKFNLERKQDIEKFGIEKFQEECRKFCIEKKDLMINDFKRLGVWMDWNNPYIPITKEFIEGEWWLIKKAHENKRLYLSKKVMNWCPKCETSLSKHELEYENLKDNSIFVKFRVKNNEYLIIWTTTPWTIPFNLAVMANPDATYVKAKAENETWILAEDLVPQLEKLTDKKLKIIEKFRGEKLKGLKYEHPFEKEIKQFSEIKNKKLHTVVLSKEYVTLDTGSGLVHCAPGCGAEDFEVGHKESLPAFNEVDENGIFGKSMGIFSGLKAKKDDQKFTEELEKKNALVAKAPIQHEYPICWRCKSPTIFRATEQWFFRVEDLIPKMRELNKKVYWVPDWAGNRWFDSWLLNLRDNGITRQRYWGTPVPIWRCEECNEYIVIGSLKELKKLSGKLPKDLHKPWIDEITMKCKCGGIMRRVPDVLDVWIDAGTTSWNALDYPHRKDLFEKLYPADLILEGKDQIRGWFNLLLIASMVAMNKPSYKSVYMHGFVQDAQGRKMSKSLGNIISPYEIIDEYGSDTLRFYVIGGANPGLDINYNIEDTKTKYRNLNILWNTHTYLLEYSKGIKIPSKINKSLLRIEDKYILSRLNGTIKDVTRLFSGYRLNEIPLKIESLFLELSRDYIKLVRDRLSSGEKEEKEVVLYVIYTTLMETLKIFAPISPFITEKIYQNLKKELKLKEESIHHHDWPKHDEKLIDKKLEEGMILVNEIAQQVLAEREKAKIGIRWPLAKLVVKSKLSEDFIDTLKTQLNIKEIIIDKNAAENKYKGLTRVEGAKELMLLDLKLTLELEQEGYLRELTRRIQALRKKSNLKREDKVDLAIKSDYDLSRFKKELMEKVGAERLDFSAIKKYKFFSKEKIKDKEFDVHFDVI